MGLAKVCTRQRPAEIASLGALDAFYRAEDYHQDYATRNPNNMYIVINDKPKVENLKRLFADVYRNEPVLVAAAPKRG